MRFRKKPHILASLIVGAFIGVLTLGVSFSALELRSELPSSSRYRPTASVSVVPSRVVVGDAITVDASASRDATGGTSLAYRFDPLSSWEWTEWSSSPKTTFTVAKTGEHPLRLQVRDKNGIIDETTVRFTVISEELASTPYLTATVAPKVGTPSTNFKFTVKRFSTIGSTERRILPIRFDFDRDGVWDTPWSTATEAYHIFPEQGTYYVRVQTCDLDAITAVGRGTYVYGACDTSTHSTSTLATVDKKELFSDMVKVEVRGESAPRASFTTAPASGEAGVIIYFDASDSSGHEYRWDFDGDGKWDTFWSLSPKVSHRYADAGLYQSALDVQTADGQHDTTSRTITIVGHNTPPEIRFTVKNTVARDESSFGVTNDIFRFDVSGSRDPDASYGDMQARWDFDGDGRWDTVWGDALTATHAFTHVGTYQPRASVMDAAGARAEATFPLRIVENTPPSTGLRVTPMRVMLGQPLTFDATDMADSQSFTSGLETRFDFTADGTFDTLFSANRSTSFTPSRAGAYTALVEVRDSSNARATARASYDVVAPVTPVTSFIATPDVGTFDTTFVFDASAAADPSGVSGPLLFRWDFASTGTDDIIFDTGWEISSKATHRYTETGVYTIHLIVKNQAGQMSDAYQTVVVHPASTSIAYLVSRGLMTTAEPNRPITRAEFAKLLTNAAGITPATTAQHFTDVEASVWYASYAETAVTRGWMSTRDGMTFAPEATITRADAAAAATRALATSIAPRITSAPFVDVPMRRPYARAVASLRSLGYLADQSAFEPATILTRGDAAAMVALLLQTYDMPSARQTVARQQSDMSTSVPLLFRSMILSLTTRVK